MTVADPVAVGFDVEKVLELFVWEMVTVKVVELIAESQSFDGLVDEEQ